MKINFRFLFIAGLGLVSSIVRANSEVVDATINEIFTPMGFDDNDEVSVTLDGFLPNNCYQLMKPQFTIKPGQIEVKQPARYFRQMACLQAFVPFTSTVELGQVEKGDYKVYANNKDLKRQLIVKEAVNKLAPDDFLYAPVETVSLQVKEDRQYIVLSGRYTNKCMTLTEDQIELQRTGNVIVVLPKMGTLNNNFDCAHSVSPFVVKKEFSRSLAAGRYLLHVRSLNGRALNQVITVYNDDRP